MPSTWWCLSFPGLQPFQGATLVWLGREPQLPRKQLANFHASWVAITCKLFVNFADVDCCWQRKPIDPIAFFVPICFCLARFSFFFFGWRCKMAVQMRYQLPAYEHMVKPVLKCSQKMSQCSLATLEGLTVFWVNDAVATLYKPCKAATMILHTLISLSCGQVSSETAHPRTSENYSSPRCGISAHPPLVAKWQLSDRWSW